MFVLLSILIALDRITKAWALRTLPGGDIALAPGLNLHLSLNRGVSFSLLHSNGALGFWLLTGVLILAVIALAFYTWRQWQEKSPAAIGFVCVPAGGISNVIDRLLYGGVVDFIDCYVGAWHWPTFNFADVYIVGGVGYALWRLIRD